MKTDCVDDVIEDQYQGYISIPYGPQVTAEYVHSSKHCDFQDVIYNSKTHDYIILDSRGISSWHPTCVASTIKRSMEFEAYKFNVLRCLCYSRFHNLYFALTKHFGIKVYNLNFHEICHQDGNGDCISRILYNNKENELIAICRSKIKFFRYVFKEMQPSVVLLREFAITESVVLSSAKFDEDKQRIYLMCDTDIFCYSLSGKELFCLKGPHSIAYLCACTYSEEANLMVAGSINGELSIYSPNGGLVTTMINHSKIITALIIHPNDGTMFISASLDGTIKVFSLQMLGEIYSIPVFKEGIFFMKIHGTNSLFAASHKGIQTFDLNYSFKFWSTSRAPVKHMKVTPPINGLRQYVVVSTTDNSIRLFSKRTGQRRTTVLPPPEIPIGHDVIAVTFDRQGRAMYILFKPLQLWIYSTRSDPATRVATWDLNQTIKQSRDNKTRYIPDDGSLDQLKFGTSCKSQTQAEANITTCSLLSIKREIFNNKSDSIPDEEFFNLGYLLCGLSNGLICFLDPCQSDHLVKSFKAHPTSPVVDMRVDYSTSATHLLTVIDTIDGIMVRIWNVITLVCSHQMHFHNDYTQFVFKNQRVIVGYSTGHIHTESSIQNDESDKRSHEMLKTNQIKEHEGAIMSLDLSSSREIYCSVGSDNFVRVWNFSKVLLIEIKFDNTLRYALFLSKLDEILISFKSQLFIIPHYIVFQKHPLPSNNTLNEDSSGDESFIFEDPFVSKKNRLQSNNPPINLASYLVPYPSLGLETQWMLNRSLIDFDVVEESDTESVAGSDSTSDSLSSFASTTLYQDSDENESLDVVNIQFPSCFSTPEPLNSSVVQPSEESHEIEDVKGSESIVNNEDMKDQTEDTISKPASPIIPSYYHKIRAKGTPVHQPLLVPNEKQKLKAAQPSQRIIVNEKKAIPKKISRTKKKTKPKKSKVSKTISQSNVHQSQPMKLASNSLKATYSSKESLLIDSTSNNNDKELIQSQLEPQISSSFLEGKDFNFENNSSNLKQTRSATSGLSNSGSNSNHRTLLSVAMGKPVDDTRLASYRNVLDLLVNTPDISNRGTPAPSTPDISNHGTPAPSTPEPILLESGSRSDEGASSTTLISSHFETSISLTTKQVKVSHSHSVPKSVSESKFHKTSSNNKQLKPRRIASYQVSSQSQYDRKSTRYVVSHPIKRLHQGSKNDVRSSNSINDKGRPASVKFNRLVTDLSSGDESLIADTSEPELKALQSNNDIHQIQTESFDQICKSSTPPYETPKSSKDKATFREHESSRQTTTPVIKSNAISHPKKTFISNEKNDSDSYFTSVILNLQSKAQQRKQEQPDVIEPKRPIKLRKESRDSTRRNSTSSRNKNEVIKVEIRPSHTNLLDNPDHVTGTRSTNTSIDNSENGKQELKSTVVSQDPLSISPFKSIDQNNQESLLISNSNKQPRNNQETQQQVLKFILSSFRKPTSPAKNCKPQENKKTKDIEINHVAAEEMESTSRSFSAEFSELSLSPTSQLSNLPDNPSSREFLPVSQIVVRCTSAEPDSDDSSLSNSAPLKYRLKRYRKAKQKQIKRTENVRHRYSVMSGYESASFESPHPSYFRSQTARPKDRLTVKQRPLSNQSIQRKIPHRNSEAVYFEDYFIQSLYHQRDSPQLKTNNKVALVENLEKKLSGQKHRYHLIKSDHQMESDRLTLSILKNNDGIKVPVSRSSSSIPSRSPYQLVKTNTTR